MLLYNVTTLQKFLQFFNVLTPISGVTSNDQFGWLVSVSADGMTVAVGTIGIRNNNARLFAYFTT